MKTYTTLYVSDKATDQVNRANVAAWLFDHHSHAAGKAVWDSPLDGWRLIATHYVDIQTHSGYGLAVSRPPMSTPLSPLTDPATPLPVPSAQHHMFPENHPVSEAGNALSKIKRFLGMR